MEVATRAGTVHCTEVGSGSPVVLLHATLHDHHDFDGVARRLAEQHRVLAVLQARGVLAIAEEVARSNDRFTLAIVADFETLGTPHPTETARLFVAMASRGRPARMRPRPP